MPIQFDVGEAIELLKYGKFTLLSLYGTIDSADATTITKTPMDVAPAVETIYDIRDDWRVITERFNWGETSRPNKVYYELWNDPGELKTIAENMGFYCGSKIREANIDNICTHILSGGKIHVKLWNCSSPAQDVDYDFTVWYYTYMKENHEEVMKILLRTPNTLQAILDVLKRR